MDNKDLEMHLDASAVTFEDLNLNDRSLELCDVSVLVNELKENDFISMLFLLLDYLTPEKYLELVSKNRSNAEHRKQYLKQNFISIWKNKNFDKSMLIELLGTIKAYKLLKELGTCHHVFKGRKDLFSQIKDIWKFLYSLCEEISELDLIKFKEVIKRNENSPYLNSSAIQIVDSIDSAEELLCYALVKKIFSENNVEYLLKFFEEVNHDCCRLINSYIENRKHSSKERTFMNQKDIYKISKGIAVIFSHENFFQDENTLSPLEHRSYTDVDVESLERTWKMFGFSTEVFKDLNKKEVIEKINYFSKLDHSKFDAFVCCYLSHGDQGVVYASNSEAIEINHLVDIMANHCSKLNGKPKLFFIQACQGQKIQRGIDYNEEVLTDCPSPRATNLPKFHDVYKVISSYNGYVSFRTRNGSWFINELTNVLREYGHIEPITHVMERVTDNISKMTGRSKDIDNCKQIPVCESTLCHSVMFKRKTENV